MDERRADDEGVSIDVLLLLPPSTLLLCIAASFVELSRSSPRTLSEWAKEWTEFSTASLSLLTGDFWKEPKKESLQFEEVVFGEVVEWLVLVRIECGAGRRG